MQEIKCPKCGEVFQVDESGYRQIAQQVRDQEFTRELERRTAELSEKNENARKLLQLKQEQLHADALAGKDAQIAKKEQQLKLLQQELEAGKTAQQLAVAQAVAEKDQHLADLERQLELLQQKLESGETARQLAVTRAVAEKDQLLSEKETELERLRGQLQSSENEHLLKQKAQREAFDAELRMKDEQIEFYRDFKAKQSTKMVGESLEQHCMTQFNSLRMTAFPDAYFEKDNDARSGSKGDFIYRESSGGVEFLSIMFEMKNEMDTTATKHRNEDFFKELDKDRREKGCEYAILVSLLESDSELYNGGIVDVSYRYPKMYVIRPQFFIPIITLLRNAAKNALQYRQELQMVRSQQLDVQNFEKNMEDFKAGFARNYRLASEKFSTAIEEIDKTIDHLQKTKAALLSSENNLRLANNKAEELSIKRLTKNAPSVKAMFDAEAKKELP